ncbi:hypothetical protein QYE76_009009 [Lolium multiflorum]|uniref:Uncharacterized protein n=1 Tax=Lolium multiflorum TaxID=4521 RepID=A0AAD8X2X4_LOLMU|nr:hypothetical protein QYE76_009009 [Lolium multiflorum]
MVKKKGAAATVSAAMSATGPKAATAASKKVAPETPAAVTRDAPGDWPASTMTKRDEKKARSLGLISDKEEDPIQAAVAVIRDFASRFTFLEAENARLQQDAQSKSAQFDEAVKIAATARQEVDSLKKELGQLKKKLKEEEKQRAKAQVQTKEKEDKLRNSITALLGAADIPLNYVGKLPVDTVVDDISLVIESGEIVQALLQKNKAVLSRFHAMIFPKANQNKTLEQLVDTFSIDTEGIIELLKRTSRTYGALLASDAVTPVVPFVEDTSAAGSETGLLQQMKTRISRMEKDLLGIHAMAAVIKKKGEMAVEAERYTLNELQKATDSLSFIALNLSEENKRVHERVEALSNLSQFNEVFWSSKSKAATIVKFQDRHPSLDLEAIAKADADVSQYFPVVRDPASIIVARLEVSSEANYAVEASHEYLDNFDHLYK